MHVRHYSKTCHRLFYLNQQPVFHEPPKVPSKSAREMTETKPHGVDDHLGYVARERARARERSMERECQQENWSEEINVECGEWVVRDCY